MSSYLLGTESINPAFTAVDLEQVEPFGYLDAYDEFVHGSWRTCMLWNASGDSADVQLCDYAGPAQPTEYGRRVGYFATVIRSLFDMTALRFARLTRLGPGSVVVPHRDYLELDSNLVRIHIPLVTTNHAYVSEIDTIYRMRVGEVWFLDATQVHSIANFSDTGRVHLLLDFAVSDPWAIYHGNRPATVGIPADSLVPRRPLRAGEEEAFIQLARLVDGTNLMDVLAMLIRRYFVAELSVLDVFGWLRAIAEQSGDPDVVRQAEWIRAHSLTVR
jgi:L-proline cis-4-hydroxylase